MKTLSSPNASRSFSEFNAAAAQPRRVGLSLAEVSVGLTVLALLSLASGTAILSGMKQRRELFQYNRAISALRDLVAEVQGIANQPDDPENEQGIGAVYALYHDRSFVAAGVENGVILVTCYADEPNVPAVLGGPKDLNCDSDAQDDLDAQFATTDLKLVPMTLTATFGSGSELQSLAIHRLFSQTAF